MQHIIDFQCESFIFGIHYYCDLCIEKSIGTLFQFVQIISFEQYLFPVTDATKEAVKLKFKSSS